MDQRLEARPVARIDGLEREELPEETIVYDAASKRVHCLNRPAALVWRYCDGTTPVSAMAPRLSADLGQPVDETVVLFALRQLAERGLLDQPAEVPRGAVTSRRTLLKSLGVAAAIAAPLVTSMAAPTPAAAASNGTGTTGNSSGATGNSSGATGSSGGSSGGSSSGGGNSGSS